MNIPLATLEPTGRAEVVAAVPTRSIVLRTHGRRHGPVTRVFSPGDLGAALKPFVFLDRFDFIPSGGNLFPMHPHSGLATLTILLSGDLRYEDTTGALGDLHDGSVEWMRAGKGVWHDGAPTTNSRFHGFQMWVALPPELELGTAQSQYIAAEDVPALGPARIILGRYGEQASRIDAPDGMTTLHVTLSAGAKWRFEPGPGHTVAWMHPFRGTILANDSRVRTELAVFEDSEEPIEIVAEEDAEFIISSAVKHAHPLVLGNYSVHTSQAALVKGEEEIARLGQLLRARGRI